MAGTTADPFKLKREAWAKSEARRFADREQQLLREMGATWADVFPELGSTTKVSPPWALDRPQHALTDDEYTMNEKVARNSANMFTGEGGLGSFGGKYYNVRVTHKGFDLAHSRSIPIFGSAPDKPLDDRKFYHGKEFEEGKRGGYGGSYYNVQVTSKGMPSTMVHGKSTPIFGSPSAKVVDFRKFYDGKEFEENKRGGFGPGGYHVIVNKRGVRDDHSRSTPIFGRPGTAPPRQRVEVDRKTPTFRTKPREPRHHEALRAAHTPQREPAPKRRPASSQGERAPWRTPKSK